MRKPLFWLGDCSVYVDFLITFGYLAIVESTAHVARDWGTSALSAKVYNELLPHKWLWPPLQDGDEPPPPPTCVPDMTLMTLDSSARPAPEMSTSDLPRWWTKVVFLEPVGHAGAYAERMADPVWLVSEGTRRMEQSFAHIREDTAALGGCLSMIGAGAIAILRNGLCPSCRFRRCAYGATRCEACGWSTTADDAALELHSATRSQLVGGVRRRLLGRAPVERLDLTEELARSITAILYSAKMAGGTHRLWLDDVDGALIKSPAIRSRLGEGFATASFADQQKALRSALDPMEWDYAAWARKIRDAQVLQNGPSAPKRRGNLSVRSRPRWREQSV